MTIRLKTKFAPDALFFVSYGIFMVFSILNASFYYRYFEGLTFTGILGICGLLLIIYEYLDNGLHFDRLLPLGVLVGLFVLAFSVSNANVHRLVAYIFPYIYCARKIPFAKIARFTLRLSTIAVLFVVLSGLFGIIENVVVAKGSRVREYLGFRYALYLPGLLLNMTALWVYLRKAHITIPGALCWCAVNLVVYILTDSRISCALALGLIAAGLVMRFLPKLMEKLQLLWKLLAGSFVVFGGVSLVMTLIYDSAVPWMRKLNSTLEGRLNLGKKSLNLHGFRLFGQDIEWVGNGLDSMGNKTEATYTYVDSMYVKILQRYGLVFVIALAVLLTWAMIRILKKKDYHLLLICASVAGHAMIDDLSMTLHYNTFWLAMGMALLCPDMLDWDGMPGVARLPEKPGGSYGR